MDDARLLAWIDGELAPDEAQAVADAVAADPALARRAEAHRRLKARVVTTFRPLLDQPVALPLGEEPPPEPLREGRRAFRPTVISLAAARQARARAAAAPPAVPRRWPAAGAVAAGTVLGLILGLQVPRPGGGIGDSATATALAPPIAAALNRQLSGEAGAVRVAHSFRDRDGALCRSFAGARLDGIACRQDGRWLLRYAEPHGRDGARAAVAAAMAAGGALDAKAERAARAEAWR